MAESKSEPAVGCISEPAGLQGPQQDFNSEYKPDPSLVRTGAGAGAGALVSRVGLSVETSVPVAVRSVPAAYGQLRMPSEVSYH